MTGASPSGDRAGGADAPEPRAAAQPEALIPSAFPSLPLWIDQRRSEYRIELENGPVLLSLPWVLTRPELADLDDFFSLVASALVRRASAIEARSGETRQGLDPKDESAVPKADAQAPEQPPVNSGQPS